MKWIKGERDHVRNGGNMREMERTVSPTRGAVVPSRDTPGGPDNFRDQRASVAQLSEYQRMADASPRVALAQDMGTQLGADRDDILARSVKGELKLGEVEVAAVPDVGGIRVAELERELQTVPDSGARPVADALRAGTATVDDGKVRMKGIEGIAGPDRIARQVAALQPRETRIQRPGNDRFVVQARLNPWVSVLTGRVLPELNAVQEQVRDDSQDERKESDVVASDGAAIHEDGKAHPSQVGVEWRNNPETKSSGRAFDGTNTFDQFMGHLKDIDETVDLDERQDVKARMLVEFHAHLKSLEGNVEETTVFGEQLRNAIAAFEKGDSLDKAFDENRVVFKAWHEPGRIALATNSPHEEGLVMNRTERVGPDILNVARDPERFRSYKDASKTNDGPLRPLGNGPSTLLYGTNDNHERMPNTVFTTRRGTATALLPENLYAAFSAFNETAKFLLRGEPPTEGSEEEKLYKAAREMRATVTRPVFFDDDDIQSEVNYFDHPDKPNGPHVRKIHTGMKPGHNPLRESLDLKLSDPFRRNAIFYQSFAQRVKPSPTAWNEMVVKYRSTGHMAGLDDDVRNAVPGLPPNEKIANSLKDSGMFDVTKANQEKHIIEVISPEGSIVPVPSKKKSTKIAGKASGRNRTKQSQSQKNRNANARQASGGHDDG